MRDIYTILHPHITGNRYKATFFVKVHQFYWRETQAFVEHIKLNLFFVLIVVGLARHEALVSDGTSITLSLMLLTYDRQCCNLIVAHSQSAVADGGKG